MKHIILIVIFPLAIWVSYNLALWGEPSSAWVWCDVLRLCNNGN